MKTRHLQVTFIMCAVALATYACSETVSTAPEARTASASVAANFAAQSLTASLPPAGPMTLHGGGTLSLTHTYAMFWGTSWNTDTAFTGDRITATNLFLDGLGGSVFANILTEYGVTSQSTRITTMVDNSPAPATDPGYAGLGSYICTRLNATQHFPDFNAIYIVYATTPPGSAAGYHSTYSCHFVTIHTVLIFLTSNTVLPGSLPPLYHSPAATEMAYATAHEIAETITDENVGGGWFVGSNPSNAEIADKCEFQTAQAQYVTLHNNSIFWLPQLWSNFAYSKGTGSLDGNGQRGCVSTGVQWPSVTGSGPAFVRQNQPATYSVSVTGGTPPYAYYWHFSSLTPTFVPPTGTGQTFTTTLYGLPTYQAETLFGQVTDAAGRNVTSTISVTSTN